MSRPVYLPVCLSGIIVMVSAVSQRAVAQEQDWSQSPRESSPSLEIRWRKGEAGNDWRTGPAEIRRAETVTLRVEPVPGASIRWYQIVPDTRKFYKNANYPWEANAYKWVGYAKIDCRRRELTGWRGRWEVSIRPPATSQPHEQQALDFPDGGRFYHPDIGSLWFDAEVLSGGKVRRSPGLAEATDRGMSTRVLRLSIRLDDSLLGWLTSYFNVPGLFGCIPWQSENYVGVDCADCLVAAWSKWKRQAMTRDWNVAGVVAAWPRVGEFDITGGQPSTDTRWGASVKPGDFIAVRYPGRKQYQHIGALYADADRDGKLGPEDLVIHAGPEALQVSPLSGGNFDGHVVIIRAADR
jgi:hypothetical protein